MRMYAQLAPIHARPRTYSLLLRLLLFLLLLLLVSSFIIIQFTKLIHDNKCCFNILRGNSQRSLSLPPPSLYIFQCMYVCMWGVSLTLSFFMSLYLLTLSLCVFMYVSKTHNMTFTSNPNQTVMIFLFEFTLKL